MKHQLLLTLLVFSAICLSASDISGALIEEDLFSSSNIFHHNRGNAKNDNMLILSGEGGYFSNSINNEFFSAFLIRYFIDDVMKSKASNRLIDKSRFGVANTLGIDLNVGMAFIGFRDSLWKANEKGAYFFSLRHRIFTGINFTEDLFDMYFYGNKKFADKTADLSGSKLFDYRYNQFQFGVKKEISKTGNFIIAGVAVSLLQGVRASVITIDKGLFFTQKYGEYIDIDVDFKANQSDTSNRTGILDFNGLGVSADFYVSWKNKTGYLFRLSLSDVGFITWNDKSFAYKKDTAFRFSGFEVPNIVELYGSFFRKFEQDSLMDLYGLNPANKQFTTILPAKIDFNFSFKTYKKILFLTPGIQFHLFAHNIPLIYMYGSLLVNPALKVVLYSGYGGFSGYGFGLGLTGFTYGMEIEKQINSFRIIVGSKAIQGFLFPGRHPGISAYSRIIKSF